jgi:nicotinate-nucleotide adenylyltransferase
VAGLISASQRKRLGIFGGTFDPPHLGHLILAMECRWQLGLDIVLWVLTPKPPHKPEWPISPSKARQSLVLAAIGDEPGFALSTVDLDRPPPHYALDTMRLLRQAYPDEFLVYLMGGDSLRDLPSWHQPQEFINACDEIGVMRRPVRTKADSVLLTALPGLAQKVRFVNAPLLEISSSEIRRRLAEGSPCRYYLPPAVYTRILKMNLYKD